MVLGLAVLLAAPPQEQAFVTRHGTIARLGYSLDHREDHQAMMAAATRNAGTKLPRTLRVLHVIVREIDFAMPNPDGNGTTRAHSVMTDAEVAKCRRYFAGYRELVFANTGGGMWVESDELVIETPRKAMNHMGDNRYWLSAPEATKGYEERIKGDYYASIGVYYKKPENVTAGLLGGAIGRDHGVRGSATWTQWINDWTDDDRLPYHPASIVSLHEWLHNVSWTAHRVMGVRAVPDCHAGEEWGWQPSEGGYTQWQAWNRDLMFRIVSRDFWRLYDTKSPEGPKPWSTPPKFEDKEYIWDDHRESWMWSLPQLSDENLSELAGEKGALNVGRRTDGGTVLWWGEKGSEMPASDTELNHTMNLTRRATNPEPGERDGGWYDSPIEGFMWFGDVILVRSDLADFAHNRMRGGHHLVGYTMRLEPGEDEPITTLVFRWYPPRSIVRNEADLLGLD